MSLPFHHNRPGFGIALEDYNPNRLRNFVGGRRTIIRRPAGSFKSAFPRNGFVRAWDPHLEDPTTDLASMRGAFGLPDALTMQGSSGGPNIQANCSPSDRHMLVMDAANAEKALMTSISGSKLTLVQVIGISQSTTALRLFSRTSTSTQSWWSITVTGNKFFRFQYQGDGGSAQQINFPATVPDYRMEVGGVFLVAIVLDAPAISIYINDVLVGTASNAQTTTFNQMFFKQGEGGLSGHLGPGGWWNRALLRSELTAIYKDPLWGGQRSTATYVDPDNGDDTLNFGWSRAMPWKTETRVNAKATLIGNYLANYASNYSILHKSGSSIYGQTCTPGGTPPAPFRLIYDVYGGSAPVTLYGTSPTVGGWTDNGDGSFSRALAAAPSTVESRRSLPLSDNEGGEYEKWRDLGVGSPTGTKQFKWVTGTLTIWPDLTTFVAASSELWIVGSSVSVGRCFDTGESNFDLYRMRMLFFNGICFRPAATAGSITLNFCEASYGGDDGMDVNGGAILIYNNCGAHSNGSFPAISGRGDAFSVHAGGTAFYNYCRAYYNATGGFRSEAHARERLYACRAKGNAEDICRLAQSSGGSGGYLYVYNSLIQVTSASVTDVAIMLETGLTGAVFDFSFNTIIDETGSGSSIAINAAGGAGGPALGNIFSGFNGAVISTSGTPIFEDYNCFHDINTTVNGGQATSGGHSIVANPGFVDPYNDNFRLGPGSPCFRTATAIAGLGADYENNVRHATTPCMGAFERLAA